MSRLFLFILFAVSCHSQGDSCQNIEKPPNGTSDCCGMHLASDNLLTNGNAAIHQFPWLALIENESGETFCTGALISSRHVLTTAQVDLYLRLKVRLGVFHRTHHRKICIAFKNKSICNDGPVTIPVVAVRSHAINKNNQGGYDIAVIKLADKAPYNEFIRPICLPTSDVMVSPPDNQGFIFAGWGSSPSNNYNINVRKQYATLPYVNQEYCREVYESIPDSPYRVVDSHICAGGEKGFGTCDGDAGSPLMLKENGHYTLVGIASFFSYHCGTEGVPSVFTKVYPNLSWINSVIAKLDD